MHQWKLILATLCLFPLQLQAADSQKVIAFAQDTLANDFRQAQVAEARAAAAQYADIKFVHSDAKGRTSLLIRQINQFVQNEVDALIIGTNDENAVVPAIQKAHDAGIKVIVLDRGVKTQSYTSFINSDNASIGRIAGEFIAKSLSGKAQVLLFEGLQTADVTHLRSQGFLEVMQGHPNIQIIRRTGNYLRKDALIEMDKLLAAGIRVDAIFAESDSMLSGARLALNHHNIDPASLITLGVDYIEEARDAIRAGQQSGSILFPLGAKQAVDIAAQSLSGQTVPKHVEIPVLLVTQDNVEDVRPIF